MQLLARSIISGMLFTARACRAFLRRSARSRLLGLLLGLGGLPSAAGVAFPTASYIAAAALPACTERGLQQQSCQSLLPRLESLVGDSRGPATNSAALV